MAYTLTNPPSEKCDLTPKNRVWGFFENSNRTRPANRRQPSELRRKIRLTPTKTASGIPYWPSRDPIAERGGVNLYGFCYNNANKWIDRLGLDPMDSGMTFPIEDPFKDKDIRIPTTKRYSGGVGATHYSSLTIDLVASHCTDVEDVANKMYESLKAFEHFDANNSSFVTVGGGGDVAIFTTNSLVDTMGGALLMHDLISVTLEFSDQARVVKATTTGRHFLVGNRWWGINITDYENKKLVIYTRASEKFSSNRFTVLGGDIFISEVENVWSTYLNNTVDHFLENGMLVSKGNEKSVHNFKKFHNYQPTPMPPWAY